MDFVHGDVRDHLAGVDEVAFCFLDSREAGLRRALRGLVPLLGRGGLLVADNAVGFEV